jgi:NAD-dependent SIR2 family protein deacetylase
MKNKNPDYIFKCSKCYHCVYVDKKDPDSIKKLLSFNCPVCERPSHSNWMLFGEGNFDKVKD